MFAYYSISRSQSTDAWKMSTDKFRTKASYMITLNLQVHQTPQSASSLVLALTASSIASWAEFDIRLLLSMYLGLTLRRVHIVLKYFNGQGDVDKMHFLWTHGFLHILKGPVVFLNTRQCVQL